MRISDADKRDDDPPTDPSSLPTKSRRRCTVTTATNGKEAIDALLAPDTDFDLILTDIMMPEVDGMELMRIVQESDKPFKSIPVVVMSTVDDDAFQNKCQAAGAQDYLVKPLRKAQVAGLGRHASATASLATASTAVDAAAAVGASAAGGGSGSGQGAAGNSNESTDTGAEGKRGPSPESREEKARGDGELVPTGAEGRRQRSSRIADKRAQREAEERAKEEEAAKVKAQAKAEAKAKAAAKKAEAKTKGKGGEGRQGQTGMDRWARGEGGRQGSGSGGGGSSGSGSGAGDDEKVEGLSVQLVKAYGGATTMLELSLPPKGEKGPAKTGLRRSASRSAFQSFLNLEDAAAAQVVSLKVNPEVAARAEGALASLAGIAAVAEEGTGLDDAAKREAPAPAAQMQMPPGYPGVPPFFGMPPNLAAASAGMPFSPFPFPPMGQPGDGTTPPPMNPFPPCPPGVDPMLYAQHMGAAASAAAVSASAAGPLGSSAAAAEFVSKFYSVLQDAVQHQQETFARVGAASTSAERRAEAIARFLKKRKERNFQKKVRYASRKRLAEARPRVRGQFVRLKEGEEVDDHDDHDDHEAEEKQGSGGDDVSHEGEDGSGGGSNNGGSGSGSKENSASPTRHASTQDED